MRPFLQRVADIGTLSWELTAATSMDQNTRAVRLKYIEAGRDLEGARRLLGIACPGELSSQRACPSAQVPGRG